MMKNRKLLLVMVTVICAVLLAACEDSSDETSTTPDTEIKNVSDDQKETSTNVDTTEENTKNTDTESTDTTKSDTGEKAATSNNEPEDSSTTDTWMGLKEEYLKKLNATKLEVEAVEPADSSTYALKKVENDRWEAWDGLLNEIYEVLKLQFTSDEIEQLREEQRKWITYRDDTALEASLKFKGGTMEHLEYVSVLANVTEERCFELVEEYMK